MIYKETTPESTISCVFQNQSDTSEKSCCITYGLCDQERLRNALADCNNYYSLELDLSGTSRQRYCYIVTASNDTYTVKVEGTFTTGLYNNAI